MKKLITVFVGILLFGCTTSTRKMDKAHSITIAYQSNRLGTLEPCGCHTAPYGGIDREWNAVESFRNENPNVLYIDAGNSFLPRKVNTHQVEIKQRAQDLVRVFNQAKLDVFAPGPRDFGFGRDFLKKLQSEAQFPFVLSNVVDANGQTIFAPYVVKTIAGKRVAILNYVPNLQDSMGRTLGLSETLEKLMPKVKAESDVVVLVSHLSLSDAEAFAAKTQDVQLILGNDEKNFSEVAYVYQDGKVLMVENGNYGYYLGRLDWDISLPYKGSFSPLEIAANQKELSDWEKTLEKHPEDKHARAFYNMLKKNLEQNTISGGSVYEHALVPLKKEMYGKHNFASDLSDQRKKNLRKKALSE